MLTILFATGTIAPKTWLWTTVWKCGFLLEIREFFTRSTGLCTPLLLRLFDRKSGDGIIKGADYVYVLGGLSSTIILTNLSQKYEVLQKSSQTRQKHLPALRR